MNQPRNLKALAKVAFVHFRGPLWDGVVVLCLSLLAACGPASPPAATSAQPTLATQSPFTTANETELPGSGITTNDTPISLPPSAAAYGFSGTVIFPSGSSLSADTEVSMSLTNVAPTEVPTLQSLLRGPIANSEGATRTIQSERSALIFLELGFTKTVRLPAGLGFVLTIPHADILPATDYYVGFYDPTSPELGFQLGFAGPASVANSTLTFPASASSIALVAGTTYVFVLYAVSSAVPTPSPAPAASPSPISSSTPATAGGSISIAVPTPAPIACSPSPISVTVDETVILQCTEPGFGGTFSVSVADPTVASIQQINPQSLDFFHVSGLKAGTTTVAITTPSGAVGTVPVTVGTAEP